MVKRKQIIKLLDWAHEQLKDEYSEHGQIPLNDFYLGVLYGMRIAKFMIKNKREKEHDF